MRSIMLLLVTLVCLPSIVIAQNRPAPGRVQIKPLPDDGQPGIEGEELVDPKPMTAEQKTALLAKSPVVFVANIASVEKSPIQPMIWPPRITYYLKFKDVDSLRGERIGEDDRFSLILVGQNVAGPAAGDWVIVGASKVEGVWTVSVLETGTDERIKVAKVAVSVPLGWTIEDGKPLSPWAAGNVMWPKGATIKADIVCAKTGRPALASGGAVLTVEQIKPKVLKEFENPYGDGVFKVTVTNPTDKPLVVPALLSDGKEILWADSMVFMIGDKVFTLPPSGKLGEKVESVTLKPKQSISADINTLYLKGAPWPRGGSRVHIAFCLGDASQTNFFYYMSRHHDGLVPK